MWAFLQGFDGGTVEGCSQGECRKGASPPPVPAAVVILIPLKAPNSIVQGLTRKLSPLFWLLSNARKVDLLCRQWRVAIPRIFASSTALITAYFR